MPEIASTFSNSRGLTLVFASMFLFSFGMISHNAFADTVVATIPVSGAFGVATNPNTHMTYVANGNSYQIQVIDDTADAVVATVTTASVPSGGSNGGCYTYTVAVNPITNMIYANNGACVYSNHIVPSWIPQTVSVINGTDNSVVAVVQVAATAQQTEPPKPIAVNPTTNKIYVLGSPNQGYNDFVSVINGTSNQVITNIPMPDYTSSDIAINSQTNTIYVLDGSVIHVIDGKTDSIVNNFSWGKSSNEGIGVNTATNRIYVSNSNNSVSVIDGTTHQVIATIQGTTYGFIGVNVVTDKIYVSSSGTTAVSVIDGATNSLVGQVLVGQNPYGIGVNTAMNKIYVGNSGSGTVSVIDGGSSNTSTAPSAPQNLQASAGNSQVSLSWIIPASNGGSAITSYNVYRGTSSGGETLLTSVSASTTSYADGTVTNGQTYYYKVSAVNSVGESTQSNEASAMPSAPTQVSVSVKSVDLSGNPITGLWTVVRTPSGTTVSSGFTPVSFTLTSGNSYVVHVGNYQNDIFNHWDDGSTSSYKTITPTQNLALTAYYSTGTTPPPSTAPSAPQNLQATGGNAQVSLSWTAPSSNGGATITNYKIYRSTSSGTETLLTTVGNVASYTDGTVTNGQAYFYKVSAVNSVGESPQSNEASATPSAPPPTTTAVITVQAVDSSGTVLHMYTLLKTSAGVTLTTGFTPVGFTVNTNTDYLVKVSNYGTHIFQHWQDQPSNTNQVRPINISQNTTIVAVFS